MFSERNESYEKEHFNTILELAKENLSHGLAEEKRLKEELHVLLESYGAKDVEALSMWHTTQALYDRSVAEATRLKKARSKPFFGRIDYIDKKDKKQETLYLGKVGISRNIHELEVIDWRAPIANTYYESHLGDLGYTVPGEGDYEIDLKLKRTFEIKDDNLESFFDSDVVSNDELLNKYLSQNKKAVLGEIIATIQKEQNDIIRQSPYKNIIVQGAAGSGKTTVAMHRISYILYNYIKDFKPVDFYIVGSNRILLNYITSVLPDLDVFGVKQMTLEELFVRLLYEDWDSGSQTIKHFESDSEKSTLTWFRELEAFLLKYEATLLRTETVKLKGDESIALLTSESIINFIDENDKMSVQGKINLLNKRIMSRLENELIGKEVKYTPEEKKELNKFYRFYFGPKKWSYEGIYEIYSDFLSEQEIKYGKKFDFDKSACDLYDLAALSFIYKRTKEDDPIVEARHVVIDEAQDFGMMAYMSLNFCMRGCTYTIMGDVAQNINYIHGLNDWDDLTANFLTGEFDSFNLLRKSYRNTIEISEFATNILKHGSFTVYPVEPIIRHGKNVNIKNVESIISLEDEVVAQVHSWKDASYETIAIICPNLDCADRLYNKLKCRITDIAVTNYKGDLASFESGVMVLPVAYTKGLEFDCVIIYNPTKKAYEQNDANVKLLYVAATRALHELNVFYEGTLSPIIATRATDKNNVLTDAKSYSNRELIVKKPSIRQYIETKTPLGSLERLGGITTVITDSKNKILCDSSFTYGLVPKIDALMPGSKKIEAFPYRKVVKDGNSLIINSINNTITITPCTASIIRITVGKAGINLPSPDCINTLPTFEKWNYKDQPNSVLFATARIYLKIDKQKGLVAFYDKDKHPLVSEKAPGHVFETAPLRSVCYFDFDPKEKLNALGKSNKDLMPLNKVSRYISFGGDNLKAPCFISSKNYGIAIACDKTVIFNNVATYGSFIAMPDSECIDYYFFVGENEEDVVKKYDVVRSKRR